ncbi:MAG: response regulator transcription factor [Candidatus Abyssubacteria bacterium]|nr:response regulator transcription factor [Candidatus Abyssubacteria bacterium]
MSIKVLLVDDHQIMLQGLRALLEKQPDMDVVAEAGEGRTALRLARDLVPDVVILDVAMPDLNGIETARMIIAERPDVKVIALSMHSDRRFVVEMLKAGASGYLLKDCALEDLVRAIRVVIANQTYLSPEVAGTVVGDYVRKSSLNDTSAFSVLTAREREVLQLLAEGMSTKQIASCLNVSAKTVETHRQHIMEKLDTRSIADLIKYAVREGLTSL